nr:MAG TPA: hypothetical protein [Bacteriophage sp.]
MYRFAPPGETTNAQRRTKKKKLTQEFSVWAYRFVFDKIIYCLKNILHKQIICAIMKSR